MPMDEKHLTEAQQIAENNKSLGGAGIWGLNFLYQKMVQYFQSYSKAS